ncbi:MAG0770 family lipoprotein [Mycoplasmopsis alligatoris]|uniref:Lipoprotein n=1 Tax=Mycoplasmopsis alligatoris A21JP2 TaxID=747682 RepID=D4XV06_9BACT|nr:hypothetical protein [Mycoplasmopsis alligatoris]EFF41823.1 hypothetical protein MALL_0164 [Mycoplasmopsis alligatoris A21JP2]
MLKKSKKNFLLLSSVILSPLLISSCQSSFDKNLNNEQKELQSLHSKISRKFKDGFDNFNNFINNKNLNTFKAINDFYFDISQKAKVVSATYDEFKKILKSLNESQISDDIKKLKLEFFNNFNENTAEEINKKEDLSIDIWMQKMALINNDLEKIVQQRIRDWNSDSNEYKDLLNNELSLNNSFIFDQENKKTIKATIENKINKIVKTCSTCPEKESKVYSSSWFNSNFNIDYNNISVLVNNADKNEADVLNFWHTHALGNILNEWANVLVSDTYNQENSNKFSINATKKMNELIDYIIKNNNDFSQSNNTDLIEKYSKFKKSVDELNLSIKNLTKSNNNQFPLETFMSNFKDKKENSNTFLETSFGKMNSALIEFLDLSKKL